MHDIKCKLCILGLGVMCFGFLVCGVGSLDRFWAVFDTVGPLGGFNFADLATLL